MARAGRSFEEGRIYHVYNRAGGHPCQVRRFRRFLAECPALVSHHLQEVEVEDAERAADVGDIGPVEALGEFFAGDHGAVFDSCQSDDERVCR